MTLKRFTLKEYVINHYGILDNGEEIAYADHKSAFTICELLNEFYKENELLHLRNNRLEEKIQRERRASAKQHLKWSKEAETKIKKLSEENEQLKKECKELRDWIDDITTKYKEQRGIDLENDLN